MKAHFIFLESLSEKLTAVLGIIAMIFMLYPETVKVAQADQIQAKPEALVFEIDSNQNQNSQNSLTYSTFLEQDPLVQDLVSYIKSKAPNSPLANPSVAAHILSHTGKTGDREVWMRALGISFVESQMCTYTPKPKGVESHNCSGIRVGGGYKMYDSYEAWFTDLTNLLQKPSYVNRPLKKYLGFYVQPGSPSWFNGVTGVEKALVTINTLGAAKRVALGNSSIVASAASIDIAK